MMMTRSLGSFNEKNASSSSTIKRIYKEEMPGNFSRKQCEMNVKTVKSFNVARIIICKSF